MRPIQAFVYATILCACADPGALVISPNPLNFDEVDFNLPMPDEGYHLTEVFLQNETKEELVITIDNLDTDHLLLGAALVGETPPTLSPLAPGSYQNITLSVWNYDIEAGERDTLVNGSISFTADGMKDPAMLEWSFTPVRKWAEDTGR